MKLKLKLDKNGAFLLKDLSPLFPDIDMKRVKFYSINTEDAPNSLKLTLYDKNKKKIKPKST